MRIALAQINPIIGDISGNTQKILEIIHQAILNHIQLIVFPELAITGYPPQDLLLLADFMNGVEESLKKLTQACHKITAIMGCPRENKHHAGKKLFNSAAIIENGELLGYQDKYLLPTYDVFDESRYFEPAQEIKLWDLCGKKIAVTICEDIWDHSELSSMTHYRQDPIKEFVKLHPDLIINLSASPYSLTKFPTRLEVCKKVALTLSCPLLLCNQVGANDGLIFDGRSLYLNHHGELIACAKGFKEDILTIDLNASEEHLIMEYDQTKDLLEALILGVKDYFNKTGLSKACLGLSGGIDSALVAYIAAKALGPKNVLGVMMPSRFSSEGSVTDAEQLANNLGIEIETVPIESPFISYLNLLNPYFKNKNADVTEENLQARIRGMVLMALSNKLGYIVLSTGNKSEMAMGYCTLYGDMCGGLSVISDVTKTQVYQLAHLINKEKEIIPKNILIKEPSAELRFDQKDSDSLPDYAIIDHVMQSYLEDSLSIEQITKKFGYSFELVKNLIQKIHANEFKRQQSAPGLRVSEKSFSIGRMMPIVQKFI